MLRSKRGSFFKKPVKWVSLLLPLALVLAACAPAATATTAPIPATVAAPTTAVAAPTTAAAVPVTGTAAQINVVNDPKLGQILVGNNGMTLYMFAKDTPDKSNCSAGCLKAWPALMSQGAPTLGTGVDASMIGSADLSDGTKVVTYNHMPLYYYAKDTKAGDVVGQGVGSVWYVVSPDGKPVGMQTTAATPATQATASGSSSGSSSSAAAMINVVADPKLGNILVGANGMTLYMFAKDTPDKSNCSAACLVSWPPLVSTGQPALGTGANASLVGSATLADGRTIVTYNHMPLYYFAKDQKAGDVTGQGVGSVWFVVSPDGKPVGQ